MSPLARFAVIFYMRLAIGIRFTGQSGALAFFPIEHLNRLARHDGGNGVLVDKLGMAVATQQHAEIVERRHNAGEFYAVYQEDSKWVFALANRIQEEVLKILRSFSHFSCLSPGPSTCMPVSSTYAATVGCTKIPAVKNDKQNEN